MATLWSVADESTQILMSEFYRIHKENPATAKIESMRRAQLAMIYGAYKSADASAAARGTRTVNKNGADKSQIEFKKDVNAPFAHPFYWSPFVLIGNWR